MIDTIPYRKMIDLLEAADHERGRATVDLTYIKCNRRKKTGGQVIQALRVKKCGLPYHCADHEMRGIMDSTGKVTAVHLRLVHEINGMTVTP